MSPRKKQQKLPIASSLKYASIGLEMAGCVALGFLIGWWLDTRFDTEPLWTLVIGLLGIAAAFRGLIRVAKQASKELNER